jgi:hypothetical protein
MTTAVVLVLVLCAAASPSDPPSQSARAAYAGIIDDLREREFAPLRADLLAAARLMPEEQYAFKPVETIRSFGEEIAHAAAVNERLCRLAAGEPEPASAPSRASGAGIAKAGLVAALEASLRRCDAALTGATDQSVLAPTFGPYIRASHLTAMVGHNSVVYGKLAVMLRMKGLVPPSTARKR